MHNVCYFEIPADNPEQARKFYGDLFGWKFQDMTMGSTPYWAIDTGAGIPGGLMKRQQDGQPPLNYIKVADLDKSLNKAKSLGADVLVGKTTIPGMGYFAVLHDPDKNSVGIWEEDKDAK